MSEILKRFLCAVILGIFWDTLALELNPRGGINADNLTFYVRCFAEKWIGYFPGKGAASSVPPNGTVVESPVNIPGMPKGKLISELFRDGKKEGRYHAQVDFSEEVNLKAICLCSELPISKYNGALLICDGKEIVLPKTFDKKAKINLVKMDVQELVLPGEKGYVILRGNLSILIHDSRRYGKEYFFLRIFFENSQGKVQSSAFECQIQEKEYSFTSLDLRKAANMGFADPRADDGIGGWTDQGPDSDLRMLPTGKQCFQGVTFDIIDPSKNKGKSCLMLAGRHRPNFPEKAVCEIFRPLRAKYFYLLHGSAWTEGRQIGTVRIIYEDDSVQEIPIIGNRDVGNWKGTLNATNSDIVWHTDDGNNHIGLYRSVFSLKDKYIARVEFVSAKTSVWGIVAGAFSDSYMLRERKLPYFVTPGKNRKELVDNGDIEQGSILDFSKFLDAPAGKYGFVRIHNGQFVFQDRPDVPLRFYGTNLCSDATVPEREWAEKIADRIARLGFNIVRLHHHDKLITNWKKNSTELNLQMQDRMDYLVYCLKSRGIYVTTDFFASRSEFMQEGEIPEHPRKFPHVADYKALFYISDPVFENWKAFCHAWINRKNPYTGLSMKDDPVYAAFVLVNEGNLSDVIRWAVSNEARKIYKKHFEEWMRRHHPGKRAVFDHDNPDPFLSRFLMEVYKRRYKQMLEFIRAEGIRVPLTDQNMRSNPLLSVMRDNYDFVDCHSYWSKLKSLKRGKELPAIDQRPYSLLKAYARHPGERSSARIFGKPFTITEFDSVVTNEFRVEAAPVTACYASLQDWSMLCQFAYSHRMSRIKNPKNISNYFDLVNDPLKRLSNQLAARIFLDREIKSASPAFSIVIPGTDGLKFNNTYPEDELTRLGLIARVGTVVGTPASIREKLPSDCRALLTVGKKRVPGLSLPQYPLRDSGPELLKNLMRDGLLSQNCLDERKGICRSATGQMELNAKEETFKLVSPHCEMLILPEGKQGNTGRMVVQNKTGRALFAILSVDGKKIGESKRILLFHLTSSLPSMMKFSDVKKERLDEWGTGPHLAVQGKALLRLKLLDEEKWNVYPLTSAGKRISRSELKKDASGIFLLPVDNFQAAGCIPAYELVCEE